jgi:ferritin-like metal-binding protein YciE
MAKTSKSKAAAPKKPASKTAASSKPSGNSNNGNGRHPLLEKFFIDQLKDIYWAEKALTKALPKMEKSATTEELKQALQDHLAVTEQQITRVEQVFEMMGKKAQAKKCEAMEGLIKEGEQIMEETEDGSMTRDVALIMAAQKVEHYEIATYGGLVQLAHTLGQSEVAEILEQTLQEEKDTDQLLTYIAENDINMEAEMEGSGSED